MFNYSIKNKMNLLLCIGKESFINQYQFNDACQMKAISKCKQIKGIKPKRLFL